MFYITLTHQNKFNFNNKYIFNQLYEILLYFLKLVLCVLS